MLVGVLRVDQALSGHDLNDVTNLQPCHFRTQNSQ
jgi:hypothetical protein